MHKTNKKPDSSERKLDLKQMHMATDRKGCMEINSVDLISMLIACEDEINTLLTDNRCTDMDTIKCNIEIIKEVFEVVGMNFPDFPNRTINKGD